MSKTENLNAEIKSILCDCAKNSSCLSVNRVCNANNLLIKLSWLLFTIISAAFCAYFITKGFFEYFSYNVVTKTTFHLNMPTPFPTISICNINQFMTNYSIEFNKKVFANNITDLDDSILNYFAGANVLNPNRTDEERKMMGIPFENMLIKCLFNLKPCSYKNFDWFYDIFFGNCYKFNPANNQFSTKPGTLNGLRLELFVGQPLSSFSFGHTAGAHIFINNASDVISFYKGIDVPTGVQKNIGIRRIFLKQLPEPYSSCMDNLETYNSPLVQAILKRNNSYSQNDCYDLCLQRYLVEKCGCYDLSMPFLKYSGEPCVTIDDVWCCFRVYQDFYHNHMYNMCQNDCPLECETIEYSISTSFSDYPNDVYAEFLLSQKGFIKKTEKYSNITKENLKKNILSLNIFYDDLRYQLVEEAEKLLLIDLIAGIGGLLGLFLGISFLSMCEGIVILLKVFYLVFDLRFFKNRKNVSCSTK